MNKYRAFSLLELVVSIGIISMISAVIFFNFPQFNQTVHMNRAARELTIALREAQARAVAVTPLPNGIFPSNYAVFIPTAPTADGNGYYVLFSDTNDNLKYDPPAPPADPTQCSGECVKRFTFTYGVQITGLDVGGPALSGLHIFYRRPDPIVVISDQDGGCIAGGPCGGSYGPFKIRISRPTGPTPAEGRIIEVYRTGQISIL